ncbi:cupin domain-containing protein [Pontibacter saemangeumensis]|uniref:Cupin domain-containing protein n=1 Tax=Pontibacter saemangeumensis TaxID=1084525 RepID=A0ABP8LZ49_9BACT
MGKSEIEKVTLSEKFSLINDHWNPRVAGELNGQQVKLAKFLGPFEWHHHANEDEFFMVMKGQIEIHLRDKVVTLRPGEFLIVPRGVEHRPVANEEAEVLMFEPASTINTGNLENSDRTRTRLSKI